MSRAPLQWWVRANNRAYGPYASERLPAFVREARLTPETSVANDPSGPWWPAGRNPSLEELFAAPARPPAAVPPPATEPPSLARDQLAGTPHPAAERPDSNGTQVAGQLPAPTPPRPAAAAGAQALLVFAELLEGREAQFVAALGELGVAVRARPGLWLLRAAGDPASIRNALSQALGEGESLMVVRAEAPDAAWFNLGGEADRALRALWLQPAGRSSRA